MRIELGYPDRAAERALLKGRDRRELLAALPPAAERASLIAWQQQVARVHAADALLDYVQALIEGTRTLALFTQGLSPRGGLALLRAARAWALLEGREMVLPEDVQAVAPAVIAHRVRPAVDLARAEAIARLLSSVPVP